MIQPVRTLGTRLKEARLNNELSQEDVAEVIGIHPVTISKYERDVQDPNTKTLSALAEIYRVSIDWLINEHSKFVYLNLTESEKIMKLAMSYPHLVLRVKEGALSDEAMAEDISEYVRFIQQRDEKRRARS